MEPVPLILTLQIEKQASHFFNNLRKNHFPPSINYIDAHLTLFHLLPNTFEITEQVKQTCEHQKLFTVAVVDIVSIGKGVAYKLESKELSELHRRLQQQWLQFLTPQDAQKLWPHITVQNKVTPAKAQELQQQLRATFNAFSFQARGLQLWEYLNGPWKLQNEFTFGG